eukprot:TRINITY_DN10512_c0_g1_i1.p1 TRINITY_DN10512_c0_g1~~TRINITY_DN10512_c0_g1_i1.p1  ORF type:complete len:277 (+),score=87.86 TRINITY_DN10512_c0_g1_i1:80-910(+)
MGCGSSQAKEQARIEAKEDVKAADGELTWATKIEPQTSPLVAPSSGDDEEARNREASPIKHKQPVDDTCIISDADFIEDDLLVEAEASMAAELRDDLEAKLLLKASSQSALTADTSPKTLPKTSPLSQQHPADARSEQQPPQHRPAFHQPKEALPQHLPVQLQKEAAKLEEQRKRFDNQKSQKHQREDRKDSGLSSQGATHHYPLKAEAVMGLNLGGEIKHKGPGIGQTFLPGGVFDEPLQTAPVQAKRCGAHKHWEFDDADEMLMTEILDSVEAH